MAIRAYGTSVASYTVWQPETSYSLGDFRVPTVDNGFCYECTEAGNSGETEPLWPNVVGQTVADDDVIWTCREKAPGSNPLTVVIDISDKGGLGLLEIWVKSDLVSDFLVYGSHDGSDGTWRYTGTIKVPHAGRTDRHEGYFNAYGLIKVSVDGVGVHEIEIIAGEA